ncbi:methyl-accepting chemotaxis sensory transducer [Candidatus Moduliflexus flocculans]|uniref:Methyl-accepting chemotaxis sensory transducer n=1 Tax=Candidatus Moduliflexus flocculans TaxID=1499966 RepID=A0A0S6VXB5_9BACT|nr:methyl-accepting chemotaxis sensory transducer [Candidatus Moduliflexus flocculans]
MSQDQGQKVMQKFSNVQSFWFKFSMLTGVFVMVAVVVNWVILTGIYQGVLSKERSILLKELEEKGRITAKFFMAYPLQNFYAKGERDKLEQTLASARQKDKAIIYAFIRDEEQRIIAQSPEKVTENSTSKGQQLSAVNVLDDATVITHVPVTLKRPNGTVEQVVDTAIQLLPKPGVELHIGISSDSEETAGNEMSRLALGSTLQLIGVIIIFILISALTLRWLIRAEILVPLDQLVHFIKQIAQGNMEHSLNMAVKNEMAVLGNHLTEMTDQLTGMVQTEADINRMQGQIMNMLSTVSAAADGNLTVEAEVTADALGSLADAFNMMVASLASLVQQVRNSASDMSLATNEILGASDQMIRGAEEQQNHINNITSAVDEIAISMQQVANNAESAARASQKATEAAQQGEKSVEETIRGMHRIRNTVQVTSKKIKSLGDRSIEINEIITTIDDIARQTTILALNAAIEAARAGEHGRGFGVVAEEVRKLAERSSKATKDIADLIKGIQAETNEAVRTMEEGTREVEEGTRLADIAGSSLKEIDKSVDQVANLIQEISLAAKQQARGTDGVVRSMETISDITLSHGEGVRKTTKTIQQLAMLSDRLVAAIGNFKIAETGGRAETAKPKPLASAPQPPQPKPQPKPQPIEAKPQPQPSSAISPMQQPLQDDAAKLRAMFGGAEDDDEEVELITEEDFGIVEK